ncbi:MAG: PEGA domain-containing protein [Proteobacteria bacterium]|nr:PEGA domain-containing protein [Pseudomonadota bacterium]
MPASWQAAWAQGVSAPSESSAPVRGHASTVDAGDGETSVKPWNRGVSREQRKVARQIFLDGNRLLEIPSFRRAADQYRRALELWPHPAFYYNLTIAQLNLVQPIEAYRSLAEALRYGVAPLGPDKHAQALEYRARLDEQLGRVVIVCDERGAEVTLDGREVLTGPGSVDIVVMPGGHQLVARKPGRRTQTERFALSAGDSTRIEVVLPVPGRVHTERYIAAWVPWASVAASAAVLIGAGYLDRRSARVIEHFDGEFSVRCRARGCTEGEVPELADELERAELERDVSIGMYVVGGAALVGSAVLLYLNRERVVQQPGQDESPGQAGQSVAVAPMVSRQSMGLVARIWF